VEDANGNVVTTDGSTVTATVGTGTGPLTGTVTAVASSGVATFSGLDAPTLAQTGLKLTFTDGTLTSAADTTSITVTAAAANKLVMKTEPSSSVAAGAAFGTEPAVYIEDQYNNVLTSDSSSTVTATVQTGTGPLTGTLTATASSGVATFGSLAAPTTAQTGLKLQFTDTGDSLTALNDATSITVTPGAANKLAFGVQPSNTISGITMTPAVTVLVEDSNGNTVSTDNGRTITITISTGGHFTNGSTTTATASTSSGVATFSLLPTTFGNSYTLTATASPLTASPASSTFNVTASNLAVSGFTTPTTAGAAHTVTVTAKDSLGNTATNYAGIVAVTSSDSSAVLPSNSTLTSGTKGFSVTLGTAGTQSITATDTVTSTITGSQTGITVNAGAATKLAYTTVPTTGTAGTAFSVTVQSQDANGNPASPTSSTTITLSKVTGGGTLTGTLTGTIATSGNSVTISTPVYSIADTMTLKATATIGETSLTAVTSGNIVFTPAAINSTFTTSGSWIAPIGVTSINVECWGGGGGGGGGTLKASGGGGGGVYAIVNSFTVTPGNSYPYNVGAGGGSGAAGGSSSFNTSTCIAAGGTAGLAGTPGAGGAGGSASASTGTTKYSGGAGATGSNFNYGGGGGGSAGTGSNGTTATNGTGATAVAGGGQGGNGGSGTGNGSAGTGPGGGGGGGIGTGTTTGGAGAAGQIRITYPST
jgi:hypothetical protein